MRGLNKLHGLNARLWPAIPTGFDLTGVLADPPWAYTDRFFQRAGIQFAIVGIMYFVQGRIAFSLWSCFLLGQVARMITGARQA